LTHDPGFSAQPPQVPRVANLKFLPAARDKFHV